MSGKPSNTDFLPRRLQYALDFRDSSLNQLAKLAENNEKLLSRRQLSRVMSTGKISDASLDAICKELNISKLYVTGAQSITAEDIAWCDADPEGVALMPYSHDEYTHEIWDSKELLASFAIDCLKAHKEYTDKNRNYFIEHYFEIEDVLFHSLHDIITKIDSERRPKHGKHKKTRQ